VFKLILNVEYPSVVLYSMQDNTADSIFLSFVAVFYFLGKFTLNLLIQCV